MKHALIIGSVWPEPKSSAAGSRMLQLIQLLLDKGYEITFASTANPTENMHDLASIGVQKINIEVNNSSFDTILKKIDPNIVVFDRFMVEEQFGWRVVNTCPNALRILNTEDLHFLRKTRKNLLKVGKKFEHEDLFEEEITKREIASIYRSDLSLIISDYEVELLKKTFNINDELLYYLPFLLPSITSATTEQWPLYDERTHFVTIGNFRHEPNWNSILYLKEDIWPLIRKELPKAELHIYGAYPPPKAMQLNHPKDGFIIKGWAENAQEVIKKARVCLAPLRFGAGIKGKLSDAMLCGTPSVTTSIGSEGMLDNDQDWNGFIKEDPLAFAKAAIRLYTDENLWRQSQQNGIEIINTRFQKEKFANSFYNTIDNLIANLSKHRSKNFIGSMLQHHTLRSTEYMSKWIEEKNKK